MNITDIDDKIIRNAMEKNLNHSDLSRLFENDYFDDMKLLNIDPPTVITRVSEFIPEIIKYIDKILENGFAYKSEGSVYFDLDK